MIRSKLLVYGMRHLFYKSYLKRYMSLRIQKTSKDWGKYTSVLSRKFLWMKIMA